MSVKLQNPTNKGCPENARLRPAECRPVHSLRMLQGLGPSYILSLMFPDASRLIRSLCSSMPCRLLLILWASFF